MSIVTLCITVEVKRNEDASFERNQLRMALRESEQNMEANHAQLDTMRQRYASATADSAQLRLQLSVLTEQQQVAERQLQQLRDEASVKAANVQKQIQQSTAQLQIDRDNAQLRVEQVCTHAHTPGFEISACPIVRIGPFFSRLKSPTQLPLKILLIFFVSIF